MRGISTKKLIPNGASIRSLYFTLHHWNCEMPRTCDDHNFARNQQESDENTSSETLILTAEKRQHLILYWGWRLERSTFLAPSKEENSNTYALKNVRTLARCSDNECSIELPLIIRKTVTYANHYFHAIVPLFLFSSFL